MNIRKLADEIICGRRLIRGDDLSSLLTADLTELTIGADKIRAKLHGERAELCSIINGRSGKCSENCKFCAQSACHKADVDIYDFLPEDEILKECIYNEYKGVKRFSVVTAGRTLGDNDFRRALSAYRLMKRESGIELCASHGLLTDEQFIQLFEAGVTRYHCNIETSRRYFPSVCSTHTFEDKLDCIKRAQRHGLEVCSGGIIGMGETWEDRLDMALTLSEIGVVSVPINILNPIKGTPMGDMPPLSKEDILRTIAVFRYIVPDADIRLAGGRGLLDDKGRSAFKSGANAAITGDMLTTSGISVETDKIMLSELKATKEN